MKRKNCCTKDQPPLKKSQIASNTLQSKIASKLQSLLEGFVSEIQNIPEDKRPDVTTLFNTENFVSNFVDSNSHEKTTLSNSKTSVENTPSVTLQNFINSAKSRISGLLEKEEIQGKGLKEVNLLKKINKQCPQIQSSSIITDSLQCQISLKLQTVLSKALENRSIKDRSQDASSGNIICELEAISSVLQDFMSSAKKKLSQSLSKSHNKHQSGLAAYARSHKRSGHSPSKRNQLCDIPQTSNSSGQSHIGELHTNCDSNAVGSSCQSRCNRIGKENLHHLEKQIQSQKMNALIVSDSDSFDSSSPDIPSTSRSNYGRDAIETGGILFISEAERVPEYLDLGINSDGDDLSYDQPKSDSEEEVVLLGEKRPTYQEITLEEDDEGEVLEKVVEKDLEKKIENENEVEELLFNCPKCEKVFRVESLLKFHIRMHGEAEPSLPIIPDSECTSRISYSDSDEESSIKKSHTHQRSVQKEKENKMKIKSKTSSHKQRFRHERHEKKKHMSKYS